MAATTSAQIILKNRPASERDLPDAYWELVDQYRAELTNQAFAIIGVQEDAEDTVQDTFCEALAHPEELMQVRSLRAWLRTINKGNAINRVDHRHRQDEKKKRSSLDRSRKIATTGGFTTLETREFVARAIERLPDKFRAPVVLKYWEHLTCEEIATRLSMPAGTVKWLVFEAVTNIQEYLNAQLHGPPQWGDEQRPGVDR